MHALIPVVIEILKKTGHKDLADALTENLTPRRVRLVRYYDLRATLEEKLKDAVKDTRDWTAFLNKRGTLAHAVLWDHTHVMVRLPGLKLHGCSDAWCVEKLEELLDL